MKKANELASADNIPRSSAEGGLLLDDNAQVERSGVENDTDERETQRQFVADELR